MKHYQHDKVQPATLSVFHLLTYYLLTKKCIFPRHFALKDCLGQVDLASP